jgi:cysteine-rich repeat protein
MVLLESSGQVVLGGQITMGGTTAPGNVDGSVELRACSADLLSGASITNSGARGVNKVRAPNGILVPYGAQMVAAKPSGENRFEVASTSSQPVISGIVDPSAVIVVDPGLVRCAECGNGQVESGETCDDHNKVSGDGCSSECQDERCISQTLNWPVAPLCNDDLACTKDVCDTSAGECVHTESCDDGFACTSDSCGPDGACVHDADNSLCEDSNPCTADICLESVGCVGFAQDGTCDDGRACTSGDTCVDGRCRGVKTCPSDSYCSLDGSCVPGSTTTTISTTTTSTVTTSTLPAVCGNGTVETGEQCDYGDTAWEIGVSCTGACQLLACGDVDDTGDTKASDSLFALRAAVKAATCAPCLCDVDGNGAITASDALALLRVAVGLPGALQCPACPADPLAP